MYGEIYFIFVSEFENMKTVFEFYYLEYFKFKKGRIHPVRKENFPVMNMEVFAYVLKVSGIIYILQF